MARKIKKYHDSNTEKVLVKKLNKELETTYSFKILMKIRGDLIKEVEALFAGSTDATLMSRKIDEVFSRYT